MQILTMTLARLWEQVYLSNLCYSSREYFFHSYCLFPNCCCSPISHACQVSRTNQLSYSASQRSTSGGRFFPGDMIVPTILQSIVECTAGLHCNHMFTSCVSFHLCNFLVCDEYEYSVIWAFISCATGD